MNYLKLYFMKKMWITVILFVGFGTLCTAQEFKVVTIVESIVPGGIGRSCIIETQTEINADEFTTERTDGKNSRQNEISRSDVKVNLFDETKLLNFYSLGGINFQNIASNDALITSKINKLVKKGWKLTFISSAVESDAGKDDGNGIFITRLFFSRDKTEEEKD